jgi:hypothetical protein
MTVREMFEKAEKALFYSGDLRDLDAFIFLDKKFPKNENVIVAAEHDVFYLNYEEEELEGKLSQEEVNFLSDCGVFIQQDSLAMFA